MAINFSVQSLQFRRRNPSGKMTMRYVWDVISREDAPNRMLIETWGGKPDGYIRAFGTDLLLGKYLSGRIAKGSSGADTTELDIRMVGAEEYSVAGPLNRLGMALEASNHEKAKMRLNISGADDEWDSDACFNKTMSGIIDFDDEISCDQLTQAMASRIKATFKRGGNYAEMILAMNEFMTSTPDDLSDVLDAVTGTGVMTLYDPMDEERIMKVIEMADGLRDNLEVAAHVTKPPPPDLHAPEPVIERGTEWGGWA